jgi:L-erythro-3,5-diaminohexanoate dehydrogenase
MNSTSDNDEEIWRNLGMHRVIEPVGSLPQAAWKLDNTPVVQPSETLVDVQALHIDSASFTQIASICDRDTDKMGRHIMDIVIQRGKMHNPVTGSGGVLIGTVREIDDSYAKTHNLAIGDAVVSLTSLSWLPLSIENIHAIRLDRSEIEVSGKAIFFRSNPIAKMPTDLSPAIVVATLDVAGAPSRAAMLIQRGQRVIVLGAGGTAGLLILCAIRKQIGPQGEIIAVEYNERALEDIASLDVADVLIQGDATQALELVQKVRDAYGGHEYLADLAINVVNVPNTEFATILLTKPQGRILFFSMATSFTTAALSAEGIASQVEMQIGNGYMRDNGAVSLQLLRDYPQLRAIFTRRFSQSSLHI